MLTDFEIIITDIPSHDDLIVEVYYKKVQWVQVYQKDGILLYQFYGHPEESHWEFPVDEAMQVLERAKKRFLEFEDRTQNVFLKPTGSIEEINDKGQ